ncbi:hypothetical protein L873DRAFT_1794926 [Choiromyces venosus 120613-1]|uniref:Uncharacterized protein n=1 Tax=Choiromyces venosus 120613-1 TaxID=1336337 RepID=A0A3N4J260_9PEZI|nr:hypothetical protein L873DRAFT_1794926 [Choiromyces venosus 120613-1]
MILINALSAPERALGWLLFSLFLLLALTMLALGLVGSAMMSIPPNLDELLRELHLLFGGRSGPGWEVIGSDTISESLNAVKVGISSSGTPPDNLSILCSPAVSCFGYDLDAECSDGEGFDDDASDASSAYGEIPRDLYYDGAAAARWSPGPSFSAVVPGDWEPSRLDPMAESVAGSDASDASSGYEVVSRDFYFFGHAWCLRGWFEGRTAKLGMPGESGAFGGF